MIEGFNSTKISFPENVEDIDYGLSGLDTVSDVFNNLVRRRENSLSGGVNCIPFPFPRFRSEIPGIEQGQYVIVTAPQKVGKTNFSDFVYVFHVLDYAYENPTQCSVHIIYFALEESVQKIIERYMSYLLFKLNKVRISPQDLRSTSVDYPVPQAILDLLETDEYKKRLAFFESCVQFETEDTNPTGILRVCEKYAKSVGKYKSKKIKSNGLSGKEVEVFESYQQDDPNHYKIAVIDHIGLVDKEQGFRTKDAVDKMSEYFVKYLRNRYNFTCVAIQQQASESEGLEAMKQKRLVPTISTLGDSKYTGRDCDLAIGLFDPSKHGIPNWLEYTIMNTSHEGLGNNARFAYVLANRNGEMGGVCAMFFDGASCFFEELPYPGTLEIKKYYEYSKKLRENKVVSKAKSSSKIVLLLIKKLFKKNERHCRKTKKQRRHHI